MKFRKKASVNIRESSGTLTENVDMRDSHDSASQRLSYDGYRQTVRSKLASDASD